MVQLLDLPLEIVTAIIHEHVCAVGFIEASKTRSVCKTFAHAIHDDMFGHYPVERYQNFGVARRERLLERYMHTILSRMSPRRCQSTYLLDHVAATINFLLRFSHDQSQKQRDTYKAALCNAIAAALRADNVLAYLSEGPYNDSVKVRKNMGRSDTVGMLAAAAAVNSEPALLFLVDKVLSVLKCSELYGAPLLAAAVNGNVETATVLFNRMQSEPNIRQHLYHAIETCMRKGRVAMIPTLLTWYFMLCPTLESIEKVKGHWAAWAIKAGNLEVLRMCDTPNPIPRYTCKLNHENFRRACTFGHANIVEYFLHKASPDTCENRPGFCHLVRGLWIATEKGWLVTAKLLLDYGADVNAAVDECGLHAGPALHWAIHGRHVDMVVLLLAYGAFVRPGIRALAESQGGIMVRLIRQAPFQQSIRP